MDLPVIYEGSVRRGSSGGPFAGQTHGFCFFKPDFFSNFLFLVFRPGASLRSRQTKLLVGKPLFAVLYSIVLSQKFLCKGLFQQDCQGPFRTSQAL